MSSHCLVIISLIFPLPSITAQPSSCDEGVSPVKTVGGNHEWQVGSDLQAIKTQRNDTSLHGTENGETTNLRSWKGQFVRHHRNHLRNVHGILNIMGWGTLLPTGVIIARSFRKFPLECEEWYNLHILCQTLGYIVGAIGWGIGIWLGNSTKQYTSKTHRILGVIIFTFATLQMFALCLQPKREDECRRCWEICQQILGYALIAMIIANIFQGIDNQGHGEKWKWAFVGILGVLAFIAIVLEIFRWVKTRIHKQMAFGSNTYTST